MTNKVRVKVVNEELVNCAGFVPAHEYLFVGLVCLNFLIDHLVKGTFHSMSLGKFWPTINVSFLVHFALGSLGNTI